MDDGGTRLSETVAIEIVDAATERSSETLDCDFCCREQHDVLTLLGGSRAEICNFCITTFNDAVTASGALPIGASLANGLGHSRRPGFRQPW